MHSIPLTEILQYMAPSVAKERFCSIFYDLLSSDWLKDVAKQFCLHQEITPDSATLDTLIELLDRYVRDCFSVCRCLYFRSAALLLLALVICSNLLLMWCSTVFAVTRTLPAIIEGYSSF